jgi:tetratricopeptide (TPR) repeat protein
MKRNSISLLPVFALLFLLGSCKSGSKKEQPVSDAEAMLFAKKLEESVLQKRGVLIDQSMNVDVFYHRMKNTEAGEVPLKISKRELKNVLGQAKIGEKIAENLGTGSLFTLLRQYKKDNHQHLLFRLYSDEGFNYYNFELVKTGNRVGIADLFIYLSGENFSETVRDIYTQMGAIDQKESGFSRKEKDRVKKLSELKQMLQQEKYKDVIEMVDALPDELKKVRMFMVVKVMAAAKYDATSFEKAMTEYKTAFPGEDKRDLALLDGFILQKKFTQAIGCINNLDRELGTDPVLDIQRGLLFYQDNQPDSAIFYLNRLVQLMPEFGPGRSQLIQVYHLIGETKKASELFRESKEKKYLDSKTIQMLEENYPSL